MSSGMWFSLVMKMFESSRWRSNYATSSKYFWKLAALRPVRS